MPLNLGGLLGRFTERTASETLGFGVGVALAESLRPEAEALGQEAWELAPTKAVDPDTAAAIVAEAVELLEWGQAEARKYGINSERFGAMVEEARGAPGIGELLRMKRRGTISAADFEHGVNKAKQEERWQEPLAELEHERLEPATIATAVQRGVLENAGLLPVGPPSAVGRVPPMPQTGLDPLEEAAAAGYDRARLATLARIVGLPPAPGELLALLNRGQIVEADYYRGIAEGNTRNEWAPFLLELRRHLLTPSQYVQGHLRAWISEEAMHAGAALSGLEQADTDLLFKISGRPLSFRQVFIGLRRGGRYEGPIGDIDPAFLKALQESNVRPEWFSLAWAQRYTYPSAFVLRQLASSGELTQAEAERILLYQGWEPDLAAKVSRRWAGSVAGAGKQETKSELEAEYEGGFIDEAEYRAALADLGYTGRSQNLLVRLGDARRIRRWREKAVDAIGAAYLAFKIDDTAAGSELAELNIIGEPARMLLVIWGKQRRDTIRLLTPPQLKKAYTRGLIDKATALDALEDLHYTPGDAELLLSS